MTAITSERNETSRSPNANRRTKPKTFGIELVWALLKSCEFAVEPVTAYSTPSSLPTVRGRTSSRSVLSARVGGVVDAGPRERDLDSGDRAVAARVDVDRRVHLSGRKRLPLEIGDHCADGCGVDVVCLDRDDGGIRCAGECVDDSFDRLDRRSCVIPSIPVWVVCRLSTGTASTRSTAPAPRARDERVPQDAVEDRAPDAALALVARGGARTGSGPSRPGRRASRARPAGR